MTVSVSTGAELVIVTFNGGTGTGPVSVPGLQVGDVVMNGAYVIAPWVTVPTNWAPYSISYETAITVADEIQQYVDQDWSSLVFTVYLLRGV